ncbi:TetR/AcrR family transcriptional regulator [Panacagrimonas sp.]|uniref:TetR/AcrR family transcriptional regulator n=1 Tax=Panacagrimonas sp. TaxID=2480088 RepID=UPI003B52125A
MRKKPRQARSRQMVDALVQATMETIAERGLQDTTTNHVAARAGVSVGSLYQYFDGKNALIDAVMERLQADLTQVIGRQFAGLLDADIPKLTRAALYAVFDLFETNRGLYLELARGWYHARTMRSVDALERFFTESFRLYVLRHHQRLRFAQLPATLYVTFNAAVFVGIRYLSDPPVHLRREDVIDQLTDMVAGQLLRAGAPTGRARRLRRSKAAA